MHRKSGSDLVMSWSEPHLHTSRFRSKLVYHRRSEFNVIHIASMVSALDKAKRALVAIIRSLALAYDICVTVTRESTDAEVSKAYRKLSLKVHPDRGGSVQDQARLNAAHDAWQDLAKVRRPVGKPKRDAQTPSSVQVPLAAAAPQNASPKEFRIQSAAVLLTYQGVADLDQWARFLSFVSTSVLPLRVKLWTATLETCRDGKYHAHLMLQFRSAVDRTTQAFFFEGLRPNARPNDLLGEAWATKRWQASVDRGHFYVWADKIGTVRDSSGKPCVEGNYAPAWSDSVCRYRVQGDWPQKLWQAYKLTDETYESYLHLCRDSAPARAKNLEVCRAWRKKRELEKKVEQRVKRIRANPELYQSFAEVPEVKPWLQEFEKDALRYPLLLVHGPSRVGKTEWACSLFKKPLKVLLGDKDFFPDGLRKLDRDCHDALVLDDLRDLKFVRDNQEAFQGKYDALVEFGSSATGMYSYSLDLYRFPVVLTINNDTKNLQLLETDDFLSKRENVYLLSFTGRPGVSPPAQTLPL